MSKENEDVRVDLNRGEMIGRLGKDTNQTSSLK